MGTYDNLKQSPESAPEKPQWESPELIEISEHAIATCAYGNADNGACSAGRIATHGCVSGIQD